MAKHLDLGSPSKYGDNVWPVSLTDDERRAEPLTGMALGSLAIWCEAYDRPARIPGDAIRQIADAGLGPRIV